MPPLTPLNPAEGLLALQNGDVARAESLAQQGLQAHPQHLDWTLVLALALSAQRRPAEALPCFERLVAMQPEVPEHWANLGNCLCELEREQEALAPLQRAFQQGDRSSGLFFALARAELAHGRPLPAQTCIDRALALEPLDPEFLVFKARILFALDDTDAAGEVLAALRDPALPLPLRVEAAEIQLNLGHYAAAQQAFEALLREDPGNVSALIGLATCHERHNRLTEAVAARGRITVSDDLPAPVRTALGQLDARLADRSGDSPGARRLYEAVLADPPRDPALRCHLRFELGKVCAALGDQAAAVATLTRGHAERLAMVTSAHPSLVREDGLLAVLDKPVPAFVPLRTDPDDGRRDPVFVVGFPRSGTTLLEQLLDAHDDLASFDEQPYIQRLITRMNREGPGYPQGLPAVDEALRHRH